MKAILKPTALLTLSLFALFSFKLADLVSDPVLTIVGKTFEDHTISSNELAEFEKIEMNDAFSEKGYLIESYSLVYVQDDNLFEIIGNSELVSQESKDVFSTFEVGQKFSIEKINMKAPTGMPIKLPAFNFEVVD